MENIGAAKIGDIGYYKVFWCGKNIFLAARIFDSSVTYKDFIELHLIFTTTKTHSQESIIEVSGSAPNFEATVLL